MASSRGRELDSKQIHEQLHDDSDYSCEFIQDLDIDVFERIGPDLNDSCCNSDHGQVSGNAGGDYVGGGGYNDKDDNKDWAPRSRQMPISPDEFLCFILVQICLKK
jgi:hypothetical protein